MSDVEGPLGGEGQRLRAFRLAVRAGWWTLLVGWLILILAWLWMLVVFCRAPGWLESLWAGMAFAEMRGLSVRLLAIFKLGLFGLLLVLVWATIWVRALGKEGLEK